MKIDRFLLIVSFLFHNEKDNQELIQKTLNDLKNNEAEITKETLSHYGKGMTQSKGNDQSSIRIFNYKDTYRLKFSHRFTYFFPIIIPIILVLHKKKKPISWLYINFSKFKFES